MNKPFRKAVKEARAIEADEAFTLAGLNFSTNSKFVPMEQLTNKTNVPTGTRKKRLKKRKLLHNQTKDSKS